jgi:hypothetical protein
MSMEQNKEQPRLIKNPLCFRATWRHPFDGEQHLDVIAKEPTRESALKALREKGIIAEEIENLSIEPISLEEIKQEDDNRERQKLTKGRTK